MYINYLFITNHEEFEILLFVISNIPILIFITLFLVINLKTKIDEKAIYFEFSPFYFGTFNFNSKRVEKSISFNNIEKIEVITYSPIFDYGGWGVRFGGMNTIAYNTMGNKGLMIYKKNKEKILIGTQKPEELKQIIENIKLQ